MRIRVPPLPPVLQMEDRDDGTLWTCLLRLSDNRWSISDAVLGPFLRGQAKRYGPYDGPRLPDHPEARMLIRGGRIGFEFDALPVYIEDIEFGRLYARRGNNNAVLELFSTVNNNHVPGLDVGYRTGSPT